MKKLLTGLFCLVALFALASCGAKEYKLGMGVLVSSSSKTGTAQIDSTVAAVVTDSNGKIVACRIDALQNKASITDGVLASTNLTSKAELKEAYNMAAFGHSLIGNEKVLEWYLQAQAFEAYVVGKTVEEVKNMEMQTMENGYVISADEALLNAGCTIQVTEFINALVKAANDDQATTFSTSKDFTLGVSINGEFNSKCANATADAAGAAHLYSEYAAVVLVDGKIVAALNDAIQPSVSVNFDGSCGELSYKGTKRELKEGYNMAAFGHSLVGNEKVVEWYLQSASFSAHIVGMTSAEVAAMATQTMSNGYVISADEALLSTGCTMQITGMQAAVVDAIANAR